jgi:coenzyme F420-reducing hydrogenase beta subunit
MRKRNQTETDPGMARYRRFHETVLANGYDVRSGTLAMIDPAITMRLDHYGQYMYVRPELPVDHITETRILQASAMSGEAPNEDLLGHELYGSVAGIQHCRELGYYSDLYTGHVSDEDSRLESSSGGLATWLAVELLQSGDATGIIHAQPTQASDRTLFKYSISRTPAQVRSGAKSRYYPLELSEALREVRDTPGLYALVAIPSFVKEVRLLQRLDPVFRERIPFIIGLICGHQKSTRYAEALAWQCGIKPDDLRAVDFRKKIPGKPADSYTAEFVGSINGVQKIISKDSADLLGTDWSQGYFKTRFSDFTDDAFNELADVTLGDAWLPQYRSDWRGTNVVIVRNPRVVDLLRAGADSGRLGLTETDPDTVIASQRGCVRHYIEEIPYRIQKSARRAEWHPPIRPCLDGSISWGRRRIQDLRQAFPDASHYHYRRAEQRGDISYFRRRLVPLTLIYRLAYKVLRARQLGLRGTLAHLMQRGADSGGSRGHASAALQRAARQSVDGQPTPVPGERCRWPASFSRAVNSTRSSGYPPPEPSRNATRRLPNIETDDTRSSADTCDVSGHVKEA